MIEYIHPMWRAPQGVPYTDYLAHIATFTNAVISADNNVFALNAGDAYTRVNTIVATGFMYGSSWGQSPGGYSALSRALQHGYGNQAHFEENNNSNRQVLVRIAGSSQYQFSSVTRNGFTSWEGEDYSGARFFLEMRYYADGAVWKTEPGYKSGPVKILG